MTRVAVVTGAASGIGAAVAYTLAADGWTVAGIDLVSSLSIGYSVISDVSDANDVAEAIQSIQYGIGPIDAIVSAAGHYNQTPISDIDPEAWTRMLRVHLGGLRNTTHAVLPQMLERGSGSIVSISSELAIGGGDGEAHYAAAKGACLGFVRSLAAEVAPHGVRVNAIAPGPTDTPMLAPDSPWRAPEYLATLPARRLCRPDEVAATVRFLLDEANFCTGEVLSPNSGAVI